MCKWFLGIINKFTMTLHKSLQWEESATSIAYWKGKAAKTQTVITFTHKAPRRLSEFTGENY
jgi:hypothetical protein